MAEREGTQEHSQEDSPTVGHRGSPCQAGWMCSCFPADPIALPTWERPGQDAWVPRSSAEQQGLLGTEVSGGAGRVGYNR